MILGIFSDPFWALLSVVLECAVLAATFHDCITLFQGMLNVVRLNFEGSSNGYEGDLFPEFIQRKGMSRE
jgi:hypothetical protein